MIWLIAFSLSPTHGSEAAVGWQWYERLRARGDVTVVAHRVYDTLGWLPEPVRSEVHWLDTKPAVTAQVNSRRHLFRFWRLVRAHLRKAAQPGDTLVIATQAAIWFHPWLVSVIPRERVFYGPIGPAMLRPDPSMPWRARANIAALNAATLASAVIWRLGAARLPANLSLRFAVPWLQRVIGPSFRGVAILPEVEPPTTLAVQPACQPAGVAVLYDTRQRKNFAGSLDHAIGLAAARRLPLTVVGAPASARPAIVAAAGATEVVFRRRSERAEFQAWLVSAQPLLVALSLSDGVPSTLYEALVAGCTLHVLNIGGIAWLIKFAACHEQSRFGARTVEIIRWSAESVTAYRDFTRGAFAELVDRIVATSDNERGTA